MHHGIENPTPAYHATALSAIGRRRDVPVLSAGVLPALATSDAWQKWKMVGSGHSVGRGSHVHGQP